uniref:NmrA-like domain-containing protein n=1 Tax=Pseudo-nitzschia delicatissima TaxID=44447 RepID=A0A7S0TA99_9STRA
MKKSHSSTLSRTFVLVLLCVTSQVAAFCSKLNEKPSTALFSGDSSSQSHGPILVVGATGGTGLRALKGLLDAGCRASQIRLLTRNPANCQHLQDSLGISIVQVDLDDEDTANLSTALQDCVGCYVHALSGDTRQVTLGGVEKAQRLLEVIQSHADPACHVVMNSAAAEENHGVTRIGEMHAIEQVFRDETTRFTSLRANLFMEELWKKYTRPSILKGTFPFSVPSDRKIYLTSVRDMGRIAGTCILQKAEIGKTVNVAGDVLTAADIAATFGNFQQQDCKHSPGRVFALFCRLFFRDLYQIIRFYRKSTETTDVSALRAKFPGLVTDLGTFLDETEWKNEELSYENFSQVERVLRTDLEKAREH